ncbi:MAG: DUF3153 domain-containing protein [Aphanocapsa sp. GSE-SYN-MK-11-07L]|nr:DUF3153 domain-containing protein [Aphanocapsa sp. GSE-SYN-MK-11-07L]
MLTVTRFMMLSKSVDRKQLGQTFASRQLLVPPLRRWFVLGLLAISLLISGCVRSDLEINFAGQGGGEVRQHLQLAGSLAASQKSQGWLEQIQRQVKQVGGRTQKINPQELEVILPFANGMDLATKLNRFFQPLAEGANQAQSLPLPAIASHLEVAEQNFLLLFRDRLSYDLDLRSLGVHSATGDVLLSPSSLLEMSFNLKTPWGARSLSIPDAPTTLINPGVQRQGRTLTWQLQPGYINHLEAAFWYPSPLGFGAIAIILLVGVGWYFKYGQA